MLFFNKKNKEKNDRNNDTSYEYHYECDDCEKK